MKNIKDNDVYEDIIEHIPSAKTDEDGTLYCKTEDIKEFAEQNKSKYRVRKLTPTECWKLMDMKEKDVQMARGLGLSNSQLYKQAGNGIVANCVSLLFEHLYKAQYDKSFICTDENFIFPQQ